MKTGHLLGIPSRALALPAPQLDALHSEDARLQAIRDTLITKARRNVTLKKSAVLAFMTAQFGVLGAQHERKMVLVRLRVFSHMPYSLEQHGLTGDQSGCFRNHRCRNAGGGVSA